MDEQQWNINPIDTCSTQSVQNIKQHTKNKVEKRKHKKTNDKKNKNYKRVDTTSKKKLSFKQI